MKREKLIAARIKRGLSQSVIAGLLGVSRNAYNQWELGNARPYPYNIGQLCKCFGVKEPGDLDLATTQPTLTDYASPDLAQYDAENPDLFELVAQMIASEQPGKESELLRQTMNKKVSRRQALSILLLGALGSILIAPSIDVLPRMAGEILPFCETNILQCWELSKGDLQQMLRARWSLSSYIPPLIELAKQSSSNQSQAAHLASQCYRLRSLLAYHTENLAIAEQYATQAIAFSELTDDADLRVSSLVHRAFVDYYAKNPDSALNHCRQARPYQSKATHAIRSLLCRIQAASEAQIEGLETKARNSLNQAYKEYALHSAAEHSSVYESAEGFEMQLWEGITKYHLGDECAVDALESADPFNADLPERIKTGFINNLIFAELRGPAKKRDMERLAIRWSEANRRATALQSRLRQDEVRVAFDNLLVAFPGEQRIRSLRTAANA